MNKIFTCPTCNGQRFITVDIGLTAPQYKRCSTCNGTGKIECSFVPYGWLIEKKEHSEQAAAGRLGRAIVGLMHEQEA